MSPLFVISTHRQTLYSGKRLEADALCTAIGEFLFLPKIFF